MGKIRKTLRAADALPDRDIIIDPALLARPQGGSGEVGGEAGVDADADGVEGAGFEGVRSKLRRQILAFRAAGQAVPDWMICCAGDLRVEAKPERQRVTPFVTLAELEAMALAEAKRMHALTLAGQDVPAWLRANVTDLDRAVMARRSSYRLKDEAVNALTLAARHTRSKVSPFVIMVGRVERFTLPHLRTGQALVALLDPRTAGGGRAVSGLAGNGDGGEIEGGAWGGLARPEIGGAGSRAASRPVYAKAGGDGLGRKLRPTSSFGPVKVTETRVVGGDGGLAANVDWDRLRSAAWTRVLEVVEAEGVRMSGKAGFGLVGLAVIRGDSGVAAAVKGRVAGRLEKIISVAEAAMVAGLDAVEGMVSRVR